MLAKNHLAFALFSLCICALALDIPLTYATVLAAFCGALLPDIDTPRSYFGKVMRPLSTWIYAKYGHRTITHSFAFLIIIVGLASSFYLYAESVYYALLIGIASHLFLDACTVKGAMLAWPSLRPFHVIPKHLLLNNTKLENHIFAGVVILNIILLAAHSYDLASYQIVPSFDTIAAEYIEKCDGPGTNTFCIISASICDDYCGTVKGLAIGFYNNKLVIEDARRGYTLISSYSTNLGLKKIESAQLQLKRVEFLNENLTFENLAGLTSVSGIMYGDLTCENPYKMYPVFKLEHEHLEVHHMFLEELRERNCKGIIWEGYLEYKIRTFK